MGKESLQLIGTITITGLVLAWVLTHASQAAQVTNAGASGYATAVKAIYPTSSS